MSKKWRILNKLKFDKEDAGALTRILLENRGIVNENDRKEFLYPKLEEVIFEKVEIDKNQLNKSLKRIGEAIEKKEQIIVFGDYDVDGITGSAILWESLYSMGAKVLPYIPDRIAEGYGLSVLGIQNVMKEIENIGLIITVDNGIVANEAVRYANEQKIDVIVTDHHATSDNLPSAYAVVHTTKLCGAGVAYLLSGEIKKKFLKKSGNNGIDDHLELAALGTIADLVPLVGPNRAIVKYGLKNLSRTKRYGLLALYDLAGLRDRENLGVYEVGFVIAPRLNASGRLERAMDSLRLICTKDKERAGMLAAKLEGLNKARQEEMKKASEDAKDKINGSKLKNESLLIVEDESYMEGVIGLVAGRLVEEFYKPSIVISKRSDFSKGSVRSVKGFNIIEFLRSYEEYFVNLGGHPMAAGFTIETKKIKVLKDVLKADIDMKLDQENLKKSIDIDCELPIEMISEELIGDINLFEPFGMGNPEPVFVTKNMNVFDIRVLGKEGKHLKLVLGHKSGLIKNRSIEAIAFGMGEKVDKIEIGDVVDVAYSLGMNRWNGRERLQLRVRDIK